MERAVELLFLFSVYFDFFSVGHSSLYLLKKICLTHTYLGVSSRWVKRVPTGPITYYFHVHLDVFPGNNMFLAWQKQKETGDFYKR